MKEVSLHRVVKTYADHAGMRKTNLTVMDAFVILVGSSGYGKSTTLRNHNLPSARHEGGDLSISN